MSTMASVTNHADAVLGSTPIMIAGTHAPTVLIATADTSLRDKLADILEGHHASVEWVRGADSVKRLLGKGRVAACLCGFSLEDGTYREVVKHARHQNVETPVIIVSTPDSSNEYNEYLAAMNTGAFDFLCYPYQKREVERILTSAVSSYRRAAGRHF